MDSSSSPDTASNRPAIDVFVKPGLVDRHPEISGPSRAPAFADATLEPSNDNIGDSESIISKRSNFLRDSVPTTLPVETLEIDEQGAATPLERAIFRRKRYTHTAAVCWVLFAGGWNDGSTGPLIPKFQEVYHISYVIVSLIFVFTCIGFLLGAVMNVYLIDKLGMGKVMTLGAVLQLSAYIMQSPGGPYPLMLFAYCVCGFGMSVVMSNGMGLVGSFDHKANVYTAVAQVFYGLGAFVAPFSATHFAATKHWSFHFIISATFSVINITSLLYVFRLRTQDEVMAEAGQKAGETGATSGSKYRQIMSSKSVHLLALWALLYEGMEFTLGGWIVTFVLEKRHAGANAGYISSGFFGGLTIGRVALMWLNRLVGERRVFYLYITLAIAFEATVWAVPSLVENGIAVAAIGVLLGPMFPIMLNTTGRIVPRWLLTGAFGWIGGVGQAGTAALPFITGVLAEKYGIGSLQPLLLAMMVTLIGIWALVPSEPPKVD